MVELLFICEICGAVLDQHPCRASCPNCGRTIDSSDLPGMMAAGAVESDGDEIRFVPRSIPGQQRPDDRY